MIKPVKLLALLLCLNGLSGCAVLAASAAIGVGMGICANPEPGTLPPGLC